LNFHNSHRFFAGDLIAFSPAFLFNPNVTLLLSFSPTGVPAWEAGASTPAVDDILENPGPGAGDAPVLPHGTGLPPFDSDCTGT